MSFIAHDDFFQKWSSLLAISKALLGHSTQRGLSACKKQVPRRNSHLTGELVVAAMLFSMQNSTDERLDREIDVECGTEDVHRPLHCNAVTLGGIFTVQSEVAKKLPSYLDPIFLFKSLNFIFCYQSY